MSVIDRSTVIKSWRDPAFRSSLSVKVLERLPDHPSGDHGGPLEWEIEQPGTSAGNVCMITFTGGCGTPGCSVLACPTDGDDCKPATKNKACTDAGVCLNLGLV